MRLDSKLELALHHLKLYKFWGLDLILNLHMELEPGYFMIVIFSLIGGEKPYLMIKERGVYA